MAKLFLQNIPSHEELDSVVASRYAGSDSWALYINLMYMKIATELEDHLDTFLSPYSLSGGRFTLLVVLGDAPQGLMPSELSQMVGVTQATISGLINALEKAELVKRETHERDGRSFVIKLTEKGHNLVNELVPMWLPKLTAFWGEVENSNRPAFTGVLEQMVKRSETLNKK